MDLGAYANIEKLSAIASANGIDVPRLRGYRLMAEEEPITKEEIEKEINWQCLKDVERIFKEVAPHCYEYSQRTRHLVRKYMILDRDGYPIGVRWDRLHGKRRKKAKYLRKKIAKEISTQLGIFNKYCGRNDVLYIHARLGGANWIYYNKNGAIETQPWFLEKIDDAYDSTYCDIYAKIDPLKEAEA